MSTAAQINQITRPLLECDPRFVLLKRWLVIRPVGHWLCAYNLDRRTEKGVFIVEANVMPLYGSARRMKLVWEVYPPRSAGVEGTWYATTPHVDRHLIEVMAGNGSSALTQFDSPDMFLAGLASSSNLSKVEAAIHTFALAGRLREAIYLAKKKIATCRVPPYVYALHVGYVRRLERLVAVFEAGQARTNGLLRTFEWISVRKHGVEQWWSWTPIAT